MAITLKKADEIRAVLEQACARRELLVLVTPYLRFESHFIALQGDELHVAATMSREDAVYGLRTPDLMIRFPQGLGFFEAPVQTLGLGILEGHRTVRLTLPRLVRENDQRVAYRVERVGRVEVAFSTPRNEIRSATLVDLSTTGARVHSHTDLRDGQVVPGAELRVSIPLSEGIQVHGSALVRHMQGRNFGMEFVPALPNEVLEPLARWVFKRREEERERMARRLEMGIQDVRPPTAGVSGLLLVGADAVVEDQIREALGGIQNLTRVSPAAQPLKEALAGRLPLVIFHLGSTSLDERRRLKALVEIAQPKAPTLLLGTDVDGATLFELSGEWRASSAIAWSPARAAFLQRLVQGMIRRHGTGGESPLAPHES